MIYLTGDTHGDFSRFNSSNFHSNDLAKEDYLIILGDFGLIWENKLSKEEKYWAEWFEDKPWTTLFVDGNHENHLRIAQLEEVEMFGGKVGKYNDSILHLKRGEIYIINNKKFFVMGGGLSIDRSSRILGVSWWNDELPTREQIDNAYKNLDAHLWTVNYVLTHVAPFSIMKELYNNHTDPKYDDPTCKFLEIIYKKTTFEDWFCGHLHFDDRIERVRIIYESILELPCT